MERPWLFVVVGLLGCNPLFGIDETELRPTLDARPPPDADPRIDLDRDRIPDVEDPCIAPDTDLLIDSDFDGIANNQDPCPFDRRSTSDSDGDGIGNVCDPDTEQLRVRCLMAFSDAELDISMWKPRGDPEAWLLWTPRLLVAVQAGALVAEWPFEAPGVTVYDVSGVLNQTTTRLAVLARSQLSSPEADTGCVLTRSSAGVALGTTGAGRASIISATTASVSFTMQMTVDPLAAGGNTIRCRVRVEGMTSAALAEAAVTLPEGRFGLVIEPAGSISGLGIYER